MSFTVANKSINTEDDFLEYINTLLKRYLLSSIILMNYNPEELNLSFDFAEQRLFLYPLESLSKEEATTRRMNLEQEYSHQLNHQLTQRESTSLNGFDNSNQNVLEELCSGINIISIKTPRYNYK